MTTAQPPISRSSAPHRLYVLLLTVLVLLVGAGVVLLARHYSSSSSSSSARVQGSGVAATQARDLPAFTAVDLAGSNNLTVHVGGRQAVVVRADDNLLEHVTTQVRNGTLVIGNTGSFTTRSPMSVEVTVPSLDAVSLSGSGLVNVDGVRGAKLTVRAPGSGLLTASGTVGRLDASLAGSGDLQLRDLSARDVEATVSGSGRLQVKATGSLDASVTGAGAIFYSGNPGKVTRSVTGSGAILEQ
jgi:hypothetical protein